MLSGRGGTKPSRRVAGDEVGLDQGRRAVAATRPPHHADGGARLRTRAPWPGVRMRGEVAVTGRPSDGPGARSGDVQVEGQAGAGDVGQHLASRRWRRPRTCLAGRSAPVADDDRVGHLSGVQRSGTEEGGVWPVGAGRGHRRPRTIRLRGRPGARDRPPGAGPPAIRTPAGVADVPPTVVTQARRARRTPTGRCCRRRRPRRTSASAAPSRARSNVSRPAGPADRQVEHVDAVLDGPVHRGDQVGGGAAVVGGVGSGPAGLVDSEPRLRRDARERAERLTAAADRDPGVADGDRTRPGCRGRRRRAGRATSSCGRCRSRSRRRTSGRRRPSGCRSTRVQSAPSSQLPRKPRGGAPRPGTPANSGTLGPQAGVDDADHHSRAAAGASGRRPGHARVGAGWTAAGPGSRPAGGPRRARPERPPGRLPARRPGRRSARRRSR